ncbi:MAG: SDR family oxidoreductase [Myxococcota bacterium]
MSLRLTDPRSTNTGSASGASVLIVGANRGIGLALCEQLSLRGDRVVATSRAPSQALGSIDGVDARSGVDVTDRASVEALAADLAEQSVDVLWVVAGVLKGVSLDNLDYDVIREQFEVNALGVLGTVASLLPCLRSGSKVALLTSRMGSIADNTSGGSYGYRMSKAALNMAGRSLSIDLAPRGVAVSILHPGWVKTDMTRNQGLIDAQTSAAGLIDRVDELTLETSGQFVHQSGEALPW